MHGQPTARRALSLRLAALASALALAVPALRADVEPSPAWRLLGTVTTALPKDGVVYLGGTFSRLARPSTVQDQVVESASGLIRAGCARSTGPDAGFIGVPDDQGGLLVQLGAGDALADGGGALTPPAGTLFVRVRPDCLLDRVFAAPAIDPTAPADLSAGRPVQVGSFVLAPKVKADGFGFQRPVVGKFDAFSGARIDYREYSTAQAQALRFFGGYNGVVVVGVGDTAGVWRLGTLNPVTLELTTSATLLPAEQLAPAFWVRGSTLYRWLPSSELEAYDLATLQARQGWARPSLLALQDLEVVGSRVFVTSTYQSVNGVPQALPAAPAALVAATGAVDPSWQPPRLRRLVDEPNVVYEPQLTHLATDGQRLYVAGDFERVGDLERDGIAALDATTGAVDGWLPAESAVPFEAFGGGVLMSRPTTGDRVARRYLAAVDRATGTVLPWNPNDPAVVPFYPQAAVSVLAADAEWVYYGDVNGLIVRARRDTAVVDQTWDLTVGNGGAAVRLTAMTIDGGVLYVGGQFSSVRGRVFAPAARTNMFAVEIASGLLRPWAPVFEGPPGAELVRSIVPLNGTIYVGGEFSVVNNQQRTAFVGLDATTGNVVTSDLFLQPDTRFREIATDGASIYVAGASFGAPLVGVIPNPITPSLVFYTVPSGLVPPGVAFFGGRVYAGREFDPATGAVTATTATWPRAVAASDGLVAVDESGTGVEFYPRLEGDAPGAPTDLQVQVAGNAVRFTWAAPAASDDTGAPESYVLRVGSAPGRSDLARFDTRSLDTSFGVTAAPNGRFFARAVARNRFGDSAESNEVIVQVGPVPCTTPPDTASTLTHTVAGLSTRLTWSPVPGADTYVLEAGSGPGAADLLAANVGSATTLDATAAAGTYYVRVRGANTCGQGPASNETVVVLGGPVVAPNAPTALRATVDAARNVLVTWTGPTHGGTPAFFVLEAGYAPGASNAAMAPTAATSLFAPGVPPGTYFVRVRGVNGAGPGPASEEVTVVVP